MMLFDLAYDLFEQVEEMARLLKTLPEPILAFCRSGARSTNLYQMAVHLNQERS